VATEKFTGENSPINRPKPKAKTQNFSDIFTNLLYLFLFTAWANHTVTMRICLKSGKKRCGLGCGFGHTQPYQIAPVFTPFSGGKAPFKTPLS